MLSMDELAKVKAAIADGVSYIEDGTDEMNHQLEMGISKEIRVHKIAEENDSYVETWEFLDSPGKYTGRITCGGGEWYDYICGVDDGYYEPNASAAEDIVYILCDHDGNALMAAGNGCGCDFPTPFEVIEKFFRKNYSETQSYEDWKNWVLRFRDPAVPEIAEWLNSAPYNCYEENWTNKGTLSSRKKMDELCVLGDRYYVFEEEWTHKICGKSWTEYSVSRKPEPEVYETSVYAYCFDESDVGGGLTVSEANKIVKDFLNEIFGKLSFISRPRNDYVNQNMVMMTGDIAYSLPDYDVLSALLKKIEGVNKAYNRTQVMESLPGLKKYIQENCALNNKKGIMALKEKHPEMSLSYPLNVFHPGISNC